MKWKALSLVLAAIAGCVVGFWIYGAGRTMRETVGFDIGSFGCGVLLALGLPYVLVALFLIVRQLRPSPTVGCPPSLLIVLSLALLAGSLLSEWWILRDETQFSTEVSKTAQSKIYSRPRAWPNSGCSLVFVPGEGIHATD